MNAKVLLTSEEILKEFQVILALEEKAVRVYRQLAEDSEDTQIKSILEEIAGEEAMHVSLARELVRLAKEKKS